MEWYVVFALCVLGVLLGISGGLLGYKLLTRPAPLPRVCGNCKHFDLEEGQAAFRSFPMFMAAAAVVPPHQMGRPSNAESTLPARGKWEEYGACLLKSIGLWKDDPWPSRQGAARCTQFTPREPGRYKDVSVDIPLENLRPMTKSDDIDVNAQIDQAVAFDKSLRSAAPSNVIGVVGVDEAEVECTQEATGWTAKRSLSDDVIKGLDEGVLSNEQMETLLKETGSMPRTGKLR